MNEFLKRVKIDLEHNSPEREVLVYCLKNDDSKITDYEFAFFEEPNLDDQDEFDDYQEALENKWIAYPYYNICYPDEAFTKMTLQELYEKLNNQA